MNSDACSDISSSPDKIPKKRKKNEQNWKKKTRQRLRNSGQAYNSVNGKEMPEKVFKNIPCQCKQKCDEKFETDERKRIFESFWKLGDYSKQNVYIRSSVLSHRVQRKRAKNGNGNEKHVSYNYILREGDKSEIVCKKYFLDTLQLSHGRVYRCISKPDLLAVLDARGKRTPGNKLDDSDIVAHIKSFPAYQTHSSREENPERKYLDPDLNIKKMYGLYVEKCRSEGKEPLKLKFYYRVFSTKFNLQFKVPSKDNSSQVDQQLLLVYSDSSEDEQLSVLEEEQPDSDNDT